MCMAGAHCDSKRAELLDILEHFRFGKRISPALGEINAIDTNRLTVYIPFKYFYYAFVVILARAQLFINIVYLYYL